MICTITGNITYPNGQPVAEKEFKFQHTPADLSKAGTASMIGGAITATTDTDGAISVDLESGYYNVSVSTFTAIILVPAQATARLEDLYVASATPTPTPVPYSNILAQLAALEFQASLLVESATNFLASDIYTSAYIGQTLYSKSAREWEIVASGDGAFNHPITGVGVNPINVHGEIGIYGVPNGDWNAARLAAQTRCHSILMDRSSPDADEPMISEFQSINLRGMGKRVTDVDSDHDGHGTYIGNMSKHHEYTIVNDYGEDARRAGIYALDAEDSCIDRVRIQEFSDSIFVKDSRRIFISSVDADDSKAGIHIARYEWENKDGNPIGEYFSSNPDTILPILINNQSSHAEVGAWLTTAGATVIGFNARDMSGEMSENEVLPTDLMRTGILLDAAGNGDYGWSNTIINPFINNCDAGITVIDQPLAQVIGMNALGPNGTLIVSDHSIVDVHGLVFKGDVNSIVHAKNGSTVYLNSVHADTVTLSDMYVAEDNSRIKYRGRVDSDKYEYYITGSAGSVRDFTFDTVQYGSFCDVMVAINDDGNFTAASFRVYRSVGNWTVHDIGVSNAVVGLTLDEDYRIKLTVSSAGAYEAEVLVHMIGGSGISGNTITVTAE